MIPDEAIEAAARSIRSELGFGAWDEARAEVYVQSARAALEAALPYLASAARQPQRTAPTDWPDVPRLP